MFLPKFKKLILTVFMFALVISGQSLAFAEEQYSENLVPVMTGPNSHPTVKISGSAFFYKSYPWYAFDGDLYSKVGQWYTYQQPRPDGGHYLKVDFGKDNEKQVEKINVSSWSMTIDNSVSALKDWELYGSNDDVNWTRITSGTYPNNTERGSHKVVPYTFTNDNSYRYYRFNAISSYAPESHYGSATVGVNELELMEKVKSAPEPNPNPDPDPEPKPDPDPNPNPDPNPEPKPQPTGDRALVVITMMSGAIKEYDMSASEVAKFVEWYEGRASRSGNEAYMIEKDFNVGPFASRKEFVSFSHIESFEIKEYSK